MCIDGTRKFEEEKEEGYAYPNALTEFSGGLLMSKFREIKAVNVSLLKKGIPCLFISVEKNRKGHIRELHEQICAISESSSIKMILYVEHTVDANDLPTALWRFCNNLDPKRDYHISKRPFKTDQSNSSGYTACIGFDGTRKTKELDDFHRDWPNIIVADEATISAVDEKWKSLGLGDFIPSPSLKFKGQLYGEEAVVS